MKIKKIITNIKNYIRTKKWETVMMIYALLAPIKPTSIAYGADTKWTAMFNFLLPWTRRLGRVVLLIGVIEYVLIMLNVKSNKSRMDKKDLGNEDEWEDDVHSD